MVKTPQTNRLFHRKEKNGWHYVYIAPASPEEEGLLFSLYPTSPHFTHSPMLMGKLLDTYGDFDEGSGVEPYRGMDFETWRQAKSKYFKYQGWNLEAAVSRCVQRGDAHPDLLYGMWAIGQPPGTDDFLDQLREENDE